MKFEPRRCCAQSSPTTSRAIASAAIAVGPAQSTVSPVTDLAGDRARVLGRDRAARHRPDPRRRERRTAPPGVEMLLADDFAFADSGALYVTTHPANAVVRLAPDGTRSTIAGPSEGAVGTTACAFGRAPGHRGSVRDHQRWNDHPVPRRAASGQAAANRRGEHAHLTVVACESLH